MANRLEGEFEIVLQYKLIFIVIGGTGSLLQEFHITTMKSFKACILDYESHAELEKLSDQRGGDKTGSNSLNQCMELALKILEILNRR